MLVLEKVPGGFRFSGIPRFFAVALRADRHMLLLHARYEGVVLKNRDFLPEFCYENLIQQRKTELSFPQIFSIAHFFSGSGLPCEC